MYLASQAFPAKMLAQISQLLTRSSLVATVIALNELERHGLERVDNYELVVT